MFQKSQERRKFVKAAIREGEAPAEPSSRVTLIGRSGSAGASPSLQGVVNDILRTGLPHSLTDDDVTMESAHGFFGSSPVLVMISCVFNTKHGAVRLTEQPFINVGVRLPSSDSESQHRSHRFSGVSPGTESGLLPQDSRSAVLPSSLR
jgi:hypothetical protein